MVQQTETIEKEVKKEKTVTTSELVEEEVDVVVCDDCKSTIGPIEDTIPNYVAYNPSVNLDDVKEQVMSKVSIEMYDSGSIDEISIDDPNQKNRKFRQRSITEENFIDIINDVIEKETNNNESLIKIEADEVEELCDECGLDHGIDLSDTEKKKVEFIETKTDDDVSDEKDVIEKSKEHYGEMGNDIAIYTSIALLILNSQTALIDYSILNLSLLFFLMVVVFNFIVKYGVESGALRVDS